MKSLLALALVLALPALWAGNAQAVSEGAPISLGPLLTPSARANGMAQSFVAVADDATASYWNPAALGMLLQSSASFYYSKLVPDLADDIAYYHFAYARPYWGGTAALSIIHLSYGKSTIVFDNGDLGGQFSTFDFIPAFSYGNQISDQLALGFAFKFIYSKLADPIPLLNIEDGVGKSIAGDLSALYTVAPDSSGLGLLRLGAIFQNLGPNIAYNDEDQAESLPRMLRVGLAWQPNLMSTITEAGVQMHKLLFTTELTKPFVNADDTPIWKAGTEYTFYDFVSLRAGWVNDTDGGITDVAYGAGFSLKRQARIGLRFDYASFPQYEDLDRVNRFALSYDF